MVSLRAVFFSPGVLLSLRARFYFRASRDEAETPPSEKRRAPARPSRGHPLLPNWKRGAPRARPDEEGRVPGERGGLYGDFFIFNGVYI